MVQFGRRVAPTKRAKHRPKWFRAKRVTSAVDARLDRMRVPPVKSNDCLARIHVLISQLECLCNHIEYLRHQTRCLDVVSVVHVHIPPLFLRDHPVKTPKGPNVHSIERKWHASTSKLIVATLLTFFRYAHKLVEVVGPANQRSP